MRQTNAFGTLTPQTYEVTDYGDRLVSRGHLVAPLYIAGLATPRLGPIHVHSVPVSYNQTTGIKAAQPVGMGTPLSPSLR